MACSYLVFYKYFLHFELWASNAIKNESIHQNSWHHGHKKQKNSLETQVVLLIFLLELEISGVAAVQRIHKTAKNGSFSEELLSENDFEAVLANFCCYDYGANTYEALQKIRTRILELYPNSLKQLILWLHLCKNIFSSLLPACWRYKPDFYFFPDINKNE